MQRVLERQQASKQVSLKHSYPWRKKRGRERKKRCMRKKGRGGERQDGRVYTRLTGLILIMLEAGGRQAISFHCFCSASTIEDMRVRQL
ncbi:hypothetical protein GJ744_000618 [Endocarpon pusillum]|uniref:Uncharacterized protein n=1 Tax=Endocarpon pusillum TaxID=364733 RepID=A0A8H7ADP5_9EURO|nr:hypothetical protein GJ744_000618 [Endocarpon pusillum]